MPSFLVETYLARAGGAERIDRERRARSAAEEMTRAGTCVSFDGSIHVPGDEVCFWVFDAPSGRDAALAAHNAGLDPFRVVEAIASEKEKGMRRSTCATVVVLVGAILVSAAAMASAFDFGSWSQAIRVESIPGTDPAFNGPALDGCPFISRDGKSFFMASNRPNGDGGLDIWVASRAHADDPWGAPVNVGPPVNSPQNDFCPTLAPDGRHFYFVSNRPGGCGGADIYATRLHGKKGFEEPKNLGCEVNSSADEASPFPLNEPGNGRVLYYSSTRPGGFAADAPSAPFGDGDLYVSKWHGGAYGPGELVPGANSVAEDGQPNVRHDAKELFFFSNRPGTLGMADIYAATRAHARDDWSTPVNLGPTVNSSDGAETRPSLSWDGTTLYFGSNRPGGEGSTDHYVTARERLKGT